MSDWLKTSDFLKEYVAKALPLCIGLRVKFAGADHPLYFQPETGIVLNVRPTTYGYEPWIRVKEADHDVVRAAVHYLDAPPNSPVAPFGGPGPLAAMLAGGLIGSGLGYGAGTAIENTLPRSLLRRGRLRKTLALVGGGLGTIPGANWGMESLYDHPEYAAKLRHEIPGEPIEFLKTQTEKKSAILEEGLQYLSTQFPGSESAYKLAESQTGLDDIANLPPIETDAFNRVVWRDYLTPPNIQAATTGLTNAASMSRGARIITPIDIAHVAIGMGSGLASGYLVGKVLGGLAGLQPSAQQKLQQAGLWAGVLTNVVPLAFGSH